MGREHSFMDREFRTSRYDPSGPVGFQPNTVFVGMSFDPRLTSTYTAIRAACEALGFEVWRVDEATGAALVIRDIVDMIEKAEFVVFDLTQERPNVYYELGYAHGVGNEAEDILLLAAKGTRIHFDVAPLRIHFYSSQEQLRATVSEQLQKMVAATRA